VNAETVYEESSWEDSDPSVFKMTVLTSTILKGEYQITNGYGPDKAPKIMRVIKCFFACLFIQ
jgi:hypothetical protein